jgi:hypothetical protein
VSALTRVFFRTPATMPERAADVIDWWESRRPIYNLGVGAAGVLTLGVMNVMFALPPNPEPMPWQFTIVGPLLFGTGLTSAIPPGGLQNYFCGTGFDTTPARPAPRSFATALRFPLA